MCVVAAKLGNKTIGKDSIPIYNCTSGALNPVTWNDIKDMLIEGIKKYPLEKMLWFPGLTYQTNAWYVNFIVRLGALHVQEVCQDSILIDIVNQAMLRFGHFVEQKIELNNKALILHWGLKSKMVNSVRGYLTDHIFACHA